MSGSNVSGDPSNMITYTYIPPKMGSNSMEEFKPISATITIRYITQQVKHRMNDMNNPYEMQPEILT